MKQKIIYLVATLFAMFGCLGNASAEKITLQPSDGSSKTDNVVTLALSNEFDVENNSFRLAGKILLGSTVPGELSIVSNKPIKINSLTINGRLGIPGNANYTNSETGETVELFNGWNLANTNKTLSVNSEFERKNITISIEGVQAANTVPTIYINSVEVDYEQYICETKCTKEWTEAGVDPTNGGNYYIYHPATKTFLTHNNRNNLSSTDNAYNAYLWAITPSGNSFNMKSGNYYFNISKSTFLWNTSYNINLSQDTQTTEIKKSSTNTSLNAYKIYRNDGSRYLDYGSSLSVASSTAESNDWVFISETQMAAYKAAHEAKVEAYKTAWDKALALGNGESAEDIQALDEVMEQYQGANCDDFETKTAGLNNLVKVKLSVKAGKYSTIITPFKIELPEGITAYTAPSVNSSTLSVNTEELVSGSEMLPADKPVILKNTTGSDIAKTYYGTSTKEEPVTEGVLIGYYTKGKNVPNGYYSLQTKNGVQQFYPIRQDDYPSAANKCYLIVPGEELANVRIVFNGEETSIEAIANASDSAEIYSINGVKMSSLQKGVNLVKMGNGAVKKILVK